MSFKRAGLRHLQEQQTTLPPLRYKIDEWRLCPETASKFLESHLDEGTENFLAEYCSGTEGCGMTFLGNMIRMFYSLTDSNAILQRGQMHVLSSAQLQLLLGPELEQGTLPRPSTLLDIGAGDGNVTEKLKPILTAEDDPVGGAKWKDRVVTTELSNYMVKRLRERGFACAQTTNITSEELSPHLRCGSEDDAKPSFDLITLFNVIDRCDKPLSLLRQIKELLTAADQGCPNGLLLLAVVLPWGPFVEDGNQQKEPSEPLPACSRRLVWPVPQSELGEEVSHRRWLGEGEPLNQEQTPISRTNLESNCACCAPFEKCVDWFVWNTLIPQGWEVIRWTRVPYISAGDMNCPYYALDNAVFVLQPTSSSPIGLDLD